MAFIKPFKTPQGVVATYHKLVRAEFDTFTQKAVLTMAVFATPEARAEGSTPLWTEHVVIPFEAFDGGPLAALYPLAAEFGDSYLHDALPDAEGNPDAALALQAKARVPTPPPPPPVVAAPPPLPPPPTEAIAGP